MLLNSTGEQEELTCFERDATTQAYGSCSVIWNNQLVIFGGMNEGFTFNINYSRQISRLTGHKLEYVGDLLFDQNQGACSVMANQYIFLCFNLYYKDYRRCRRSTGPLESFTEVEPSMYAHDYAKTSCSDSKYSFHWL